MVGMEVFERWERGTLYVSDVMSKPVRKVSEDTGLSKAVKAMKRFGIGCLVVTRKGAPIGIITEGDILMRSSALGLDLRNAKVKAVTSEPLITVENDATIEAAARLMVVNSIKRLPVMRNGTLVGIITATDIVRREPVLVKLLDDLARRKRSND